MFLIKNKLIVYLLTYLMSITIKDQALSQ